MSLYLPQEPYLTPKAAVFETNIGNSVFAIDRIERLELVAVFGGNIISAEVLALLPPEDRSMTLQVDTDNFSFSAVRHATDYINHGCDPNLGFDHDGNLRAMSDILPESELRFDYSMADSTAFDEFVCLCGSQQCRGRVTGEDWKDPELRKRYNGWFMPYLQKKVDETITVTPVSS